MSSFGNFVRCYLTAYKGEQRAWWRKLIDIANDVIGNESYIHDPYTSFHLKERNFTPHADLELESIQ